MSGLWIGETGLEREERWPAGLTCLFVVGSSSALWALIIISVGWLIA